MKMKLSTKSAKSFAFSEEGLEVLSKAFHSENVLIKNCKIYQKQIFTDDTTGSMIALSTLNNQNK